MTFETERLIIRTSDSSFSGELLRYYSENRVFFEKHEPVWPEQYYTQEYQRRMLEAEEQNMEKQASAYYYFSRKEDGISFPWKQLGKQFLGYLPALALSLLVYVLLPSGLLRLGVEMALMGVYALVYVLFVQKNELVLNFLQSAFRRWQG